MSPSETDLVAIRHAAQALVAIKCGHPVASVSLHLGGSMSYPNKHSLELDDPRVAFCEVQIDLAGPIGESIHRFGADQIDLGVDWSHLGTDLAGALHQAKLIASDTGRPAEEVLCKAAVAAYAKLSKNWPTVIAIAAELSREEIQGLLAGFEIYPIVKRFEGVGPLADAA